MENFVSQIIVKLKEKKIKQITRSINKYYNVKKNKKIEK